MSPDVKFLILMAVSAIVFVIVVRVALRRRRTRPSWARLGTLALIICAGGMTFARFGAQTGLPWTVYYTFPALATIAAPPLFLAMTWRETRGYIVLSALSAPAIHAAFSFLFGWTEYMPFLRVPYWRDVCGALA